MRFSIRDLLWATVVVAMGLGWSFGPRVASAQVSKEAIAPTYRFDHKDLAAPDDVGALAAERFVVDPTGKFIGCIFLRRPITAASHTPVLCVWDITGKHRVYTSRQKGDRTTLWPYDADFDRNGRLLGIAGMREVGLWDLQAGKYRWRRQLPVNRVRAVRFNPAGDGLVVSADPQEVEKPGESRWRATIFRLDADKGHSLARGFEPRGDVDRLWFSANGSSVVTISKNNTLRVLDGRKLTEKSVVKGREDIDIGAVTIDSAVRLPDGRTYVSAGTVDRPGTHHGFISVRDTDNGKEIFQKDVPLLRPMVAKSNDGRMVAVCGHFSPEPQKSTTRWEILLIETSNWKEKARIVAAKGLESVVFSPDGKVVLGGSFNGNIEMWAVASGRRLGSIATGGPSEVSAIRFTSDGDVLFACAAGSGIIKGWKWTDVTRGVKLE
jgi:hypothetical protein